MNELPRLLITMGDVAGIGPEIIARAWPALNEICHPVVVGDPGWTRRALELVGSSAAVQTVHRPEEVEPTPGRIACLLATDQDLSRVKSARVSAAAGRAA